MEFQSTLQDQPPQSETCVVFDQRDGRIVLVHEFIGDGTGLYGPQGGEERARITLDSARHRHKEPGQLQVLHLPRDFRWEPQTLYRVDVPSGKLVVRARLEDAARMGRRTSSATPQT